MRAFKPWLAVIAALASCATPFGEAEPPLPSPAPSAPPSGSSPPPPRPSSSQPDAAVDAIAAPVPACDPTKPFGPPERLGNVNSTSDDRSPRVGVDGLSLWFSSARPEAAGTAGIFMATRSLVQADFAGVTPVPLESGKKTFIDPTLTADLLTMYVVSTGPTTSGGGDIYFATRASTTDAFGPLLLLPNVNSAELEGTPYVVPDGTALYFGSLREGAFFVYRAARNGGSFDAPVRLAELDAPMLGRRDAPVVTGDELTIYFAGLKAEISIYMARRASKDVPFGPVVLVEELATQAHEMPSSVSADGCTLYFTSDIGPGFPTSTGNDMFRATRPK